MKEIKLYLKDNKLFEEIGDALIVDKIVEEIIVEEDKTIVKIDDSIKDNLLDFYYNVGIYLVIRYVRMECNKYPKKYHDEIESAICDANYFYGIMFMELMRYFQTNDTLKENIFLSFNVKGFKEEIAQFYQGLRYKEERNAFSQSFYDDLVKSGVDLEKYEVLKVGYEENNIQLIALDGDIITGKNIAKKFKIELKFDTSDKWLYDLAFCSTLCMILKVKELIIPKEYVELYEDLLKHNDMDVFNTKLILGD